MEEAYELAFTPGTGTSGFRLCIDLVYLLVYSRFFKVRKVSPLQNIRWSVVWVIESFVLDWFHMAWTSIVIYLFLSIFHFSTCVLFFSSYFYLGGAAVSSDNDVEINE